jgi:hypothetical protein
VCLRPRNRSRSRDGGSAVVAAASGSHRQISNWPTVVDRVWRIAKTASPISSAIGLVGITIRFENLIAARTKQELLSHFSEARSAIFAEEKVKQRSGHDQTSLFDRLIVPLTGLPRGELDHSSRAVIGRSPVSIAVMKRNP